MAAGARRALGLVSLILVAGAIVLMFFVILSGVTGSTPLNKTYFLQVDTSRLINAPRPLSQWTYFFVCGAGNRDCGAPVPALPVGYGWLGASSVPAQLVGHHAKGTTSTHYYYLWRFGWVFYLIALVSAVVAFFTGLFSFTRLGAGFSGLVALSATFWMALAASLMTAEFVQMRDAFRSAGIGARLGRYAFGFTWAAFTCLLLSTILFFMGCGIGGNRKEGRPSRTSNVGFFRRQRSTKSRGSFVDNESQRRVKDEYA